MYTGGDISTTTCPWNCITGYYPDVFGPCYKCYLTAKSYPTSYGTSAGPSSRSWACNAGYYVSGSSCGACEAGKYKTTASPDLWLSCSAICLRAGTYESIACTTTTNSVCSSCTNLVSNAVYTGVG